MQVPNPRVVPRCHWKKHQWQDWRLLGWVMVQICARCGRANLKDTRPKGLKECWICRTPLTGRKRNWCSNRDCLTLWGAHKNPRYWRDFVTKRDHNTCQDCGQVGVKMEAHHILPVSQGGIECDLENGVLLCVACHLERHRTLRSNEE